MYYLSVYYYIILFRKGPTQANNSVKLSNFFTEFRIFPPQLLTKYLILNSSLEIGHCRKDSSVVLLLYSPSKHSGLLRPGNQSMNFGF